MFDKEFFPTPKQVIMDMLRPYKHNVYGLMGRTILEPSAGSGSILESIASEANLHQYKLYAIERNLELCEIIKGKGYKLIGNDFLTYSGKIQFDLIVMNPPFSNGDEHLLKAWDILSSGDIVCLLNEETIKNPYTAKRKLLAAIIQQYGSVEYIGPVFASADRKTNAGIAMVRLIKPEVEGSKFYFQPMKGETKRDFNVFDHTNQIARKDVIGNNVSCYNAASDALIEMIQGFAKAQFYLDQIGIDLKYFEWKNLLTNNPKQSFNNVITEANQKAWNQVINQSKISDYFNSEMKKNFYKFHEQQGNMEFTEENINNLFYMVAENSQHIKARCVELVFENFTRYDKKNTVHIEGWKTNKAWKVNKKVILPNFIKMDYSFSMNYMKRDEMIDIDKAMAFLSGDKFSEVKTVYDTLHDCFTTIRQFTYESIIDDDKLESTYFKIQYFKKGTVHLTFKNEKLLQRFNLFVAKGRNWLPPTEN